MTIGRSVPSGEVITGRRRIAHYADRSERTISRWIKRGILPATRAAECPNQPLAVAAPDLETVKRIKETVDA